MKKWICWCCTLAVLLSLSGCGSREEVPAAETTVPAAVVETEPPVAMEPAVYYHGDENAEKLVQAEGKIPGLSPQNLIDLLARKKVIPEGIVVWEFSQEDGILSLDLSHEFGDAAAQMGTSGEYIILGSLTNTFLTAYGADGLNLTIEGNPLETGHNIYDFTLKFFQ